MLVDRTPQQVRFATQRDEHFVEVPRATRLASRRFYAASKAFAKFVAPASDGLVCHGHTALEEQFLDVAQAQLKAEGSAQRNRLPRLGNDDRDRSISISSSRHLTSSAQQPDNAGPLQPFDEYPWSSAFVSTSDARRHKRFQL